MVRVEMRLCHKMNSPIAPQRKGRTSARQRAALAVILALPLVSCAPERPYGAVGRISGFAGFVVADEPRAAMAGRDVLEAGGTAADAAIAASFALGVTLPAQAGLGAGGVCLAYDHGKQSVEALDFTAPPRSSPVPAMARGLYALHAKYGGGLGWEQLVLPAERMARLGQPVSRALARRLAAWPSGEIDPATKAVFFRADGRPLGEGDNLEQPALGATLARIRVNGAGALYDGKGADDLAKSLAGLAADAPGAAEIRAFLPQWHAAGKIALHDDFVYFPQAVPLPAGEGEVWTRVLAGSGREADALADARVKPLLDYFAARTPPVQAASAGVVAVGRDGSAVACDFAMGKPFGGGHVAADTGLMLAASPLPNLQPILATNTAGSEFRFAVAAPAASAATPAPAGLAAVACAGAPPRAEICRAGSDPKGAGLASLAGGE
jgi:gamma-glutamyltranspeptidase/glutathione hydrolase